MQTNQQNNETFESSITTTTTTITVNKSNNKHRKQFQKFKNACAKITTFFFSRVGLCFLIIGYVAVGGFIFRSIEGAHELEEKLNNKSIMNDIDTETENLAIEIWNMTKMETVFHEKNYTTKLKTRLIEFRKILSNAVKQGYSNLNNTKWTYSSSMLYASTIVTTIGYGHITCVTDTGKIVTMLYAVIGIPMMFLCLANVGSSMAYFFRFIYARICCSYCNYVKKINKRKRFKLATQMNVASFSALALAKNNKDYSDAAIKKEEEAKNSKITSEQQAEIIDLFEDSISVDYKKTTVPVSITLLILSSYIIVGGILFKTLENWSILDGIYFCFVTLSTIGLGDLVPGNSINEVDHEAEYKLFSVSLYLLMGLNLISMCFSLMQEEVTAKFRRLAIRLGIIDDPNYYW